MEETKAFKKGQKQIAKQWKDSWLSTNARLDIVLRAMNHDDSESETAEQILQRTKEKAFLTQKEIGQLLHNMVIDGYVVEEKSEPSVFYISTNGKVFIENNGYA